nr:hypothetical protein [Tanacetum cinerariifolium]
MHKAFPLLVRKFSLPEGTSHCLKKNATARRKVLPLPEVCTAIIVKEKPSVKDDTVAQLEGRLVEYKEREVKYIEKIRTLEMYKESNLKCIKTLDKELETLKLEKDGLDGKLEGLLKASKNLDNLIESQRSDKVKDGVGYNVVPPLTANLYLSPKKDLSFTGLPEFVDDTVTDYSRPSPTVKILLLLRMSAGHRPHGASMRPSHRPAGHKPHGPSMNHMRPDMNSARPNRSNNSLVNRKFSTGRRNFPTVNRKFPTASRKFTTGSTKIHTADMGRKGKAVKPSDNLGKFEAKGDEGKKDAANQEVKKDVSSLRYIALPNWVHDALLESSSCKPQNRCSPEVPEGSGNINPTASTPNPSAEQMETLTVETPIPTDKYIGDILKKFRYSDVRSSNSPMDKENPWGKDGTGKDVDLYLYRSMIGSLMYLTASRPDIMFAGHPKLGLWYPKASPFDLVAYSYSDYGGASQDQCQQQDFKILNVSKVFDDMSKDESVWSNNTYSSVCGTFHTKKLFTTLRVNSPSFSGKIVPLFDTMLVHQGEGSCTPTEPHHTPSSEDDTSHPTTSSIPLPSLHTAPILPVTQTNTTPIRQYSRRARIAQSSALSTVVDEPASLVRDVSEGEACPTESGFIADQDRATIAKSSTLPHNSAPRVTSTATDEGSSGGGNSYVEGKGATTVLAGGIDVPTGSGSIPTIGPPATVISTGSEIDAQVARELEEQQEKEDMRMNEQITRDAEVARIHAEEELQGMIDSLDMSNETIANDLVKYQENYSKVYKFQSQQRRPMTKKQKRDYYMAMIRKNLGWKVKDFKGMTFEEIEAKFIKVWKQVEDFIPIGLKEEAERLKRKGLNLEQEHVNKQKSSEEAPEIEKSTEEITKEKIKEMMQLVPVEDVYVQAPFKSNILSLTGRFT